MSDIYYYYNLKKNLTRHYNSFENINKDDRLMDISKFVKINRDMGIEVPLHKLNELFKKKVGPTGKHLMTKNEFLDVMLEVFMEV